MTAHSVRPSHVDPPLADEMHREDGAPLHAWRHAFRSLDELYRRAAPRLVGHLARHVQRIVAMRVLYGEDQAIVEATSIVAALSSRGVS